MAMATSAQLRREILAGQWDEALSTLYGTEPAVLARQRQRYAAALESMAGERNRLLNYFQYYDGKLGGRLEDYRLEMLQRYARTFSEKLERLKGETRQAYALFYQETTVGEVIRTRFGYLEKLLAELQRLLADTRPL